jgi:hypothetical protein
VGDSPYKNKLDDAARDRIRQDLKKILQGGNRLPHGSTQKLMKKYNVSAAMVWYYKGQLVKGALPPSKAPAAGVSASKLQARMRKLGMRVKGFRKGKRLGVGANFCTYCGTGLGGAVVVRFCPSCGGGLLQ